VIFDKDLMFSEDQAITASAASDNVIDLGDSGDQSNGEPVYLHCQVSEDFSTATGATLSITVQESDTDSFGSPIDLVTSASAATTDLKAGYTFSLGSLPSNSKRYMRLYYNAASNFSAGKITAGLVLTKQSNS
jgi:hypothetical protein